MDKPHCGAFRAARMPHRRDFVMNIVTIPVDQIVSNSYNPNEMTDEQFSELVEQTRRSGHVFKPIVVRRDNDRFIIVDGEHTWLAAKDVGLAEVECEVMDISELEAMRQMLVRNLHGEHDPVQEARVYQRMMALGKLSNRQLAKQVSKSEAGIRNTLKYLDALEEYQPAEGENPEEVVGKLTMKQIELFLKIPQHCVQLGYVPAVTPIFGSGFSIHPIFRWTGSCSGSWMRVSPA